MPEKDTEVMNHYDDYSVEELKTALQRIFFYSDLEDADIEEMEQILAVLRQKAPFYHPRTSKALWAEFKEEHAKEFAALGIQKITDTEEVVKEAPEANAVETRMLPKSEKRFPQKSRGLLRVAMIAALMVVIIVAATITASAMGLNLWGWVPKWNSEAFSFGGESPEPNELNDASPISAALTQLEIHEPVYPHWLPEGFVSTTTVIETEPIFLHESYFKGDQYISITIEPSEYIDTGMYQKDDTFPCEYYTGNHIHYIFADFEQYSATWTCGDLTVLVMGNVSLDEMKRIIDSVYEGES